MNIQGMPNRTVPSLAVLAFALGVVFGAAAQDVGAGRPAASASGLAFAGSVDWSGRYLDCRVSLDLVAAGLRMPTGRSQAEESADMNFPELARSSLYGLPVDSSTTLSDAAARGSLGWEDLDQALRGAVRRSSVLSSDLTSLYADYRIDMGALAKALVRHRRPSEPEPLLAATPTRAYTGIVIYAQGSLPVHGTRRSSPLRLCFFPRIWSENMTLVYERNFVEPEVAAGRGIVRYGDREDPASYADLVGDDPLRVLAREAFGVMPTDPVISEADAARILGSEANRELLRQGKVVVVVDRGSLSESLGSTGN